MCVEEAGAKQKVARAEIEFGYTGKPTDRSALQVAKEKCDAMAGDPKASRACDAKLGFGKN